MLIVYPVLKYSKSPLIARHGFTTPAGLAPIFAPVAVQPLPTTPPLYPKKFLVTWRAGTPPQQDNQTAYNVLNVPCSARILLST